MRRDVRVLIVDDHPPIRASVTAILKAAGAGSLDYAADAASALETLRLARPDLVVADALMGDMDGLELVRLMRDAVAGSGDPPPIVMLSPLAEPSFVMQARAAGVAALVAKPVSATDLMARIDEAMIAAVPKVAVPAAETRTA